MELFSVICTTCQSRLKVRDRGAIGQILACPKCQGMVLVQPPPGWVDRGEDESQSVAPLPDANSTSNTTHPPTIAAATTSTIAASNFEDAAALLSEPSQPAPPPAVTAPPAAASAASTASAAPPTSAPAPATEVIAAAPLGETLPPNTDWTSPATQRIKQWVLLGGVATTGVVVLISAAVYAVSALSGPRVEDAVVVQANDSNQAPIDEVADPPRENADPTPVVEPEPAPPIPEEIPSPEPPAAEPTPQPMSSDPPVAPQAPAANNTPPELAADPVDSSPKPLNNFSVEKTLEQFGSLIEAQPYETQPTGDGPRIPEASSEDDGAANAAEPYVEESLPRPSTRNIDVARRLDDPLAGIEMSDVALADFLNFVTDLTLVPITLDTTALPAIKCSPETPLKISLQKTTIAQMLAQALGPRNLAFVTRENQIVVMPVASVQGKPKTIQHDVTDLCASEEQVLELAELLTKVIEPDSWADAEGVGYSIDGKQIVVTQRPAVHYALVVLLDKLRLARKLPPRSPYPAEVITLIPKAIAADAILSTPVTMNFVPPTRIGKVAEHLHRAAGLRMLVDWEAIASAGWTPEGEVKAGVANQPLRQFLDRLTGRMEITWRVIDSQTVELTTPSALAAHPDVEVHPVAVADSTALIAKIKAQLGAALFAPGSTAALVYEPRSKAILARLPQPAQRQLIEILATP